MWRARARSGVRTPSACGRYCVTRRNERSSERELDSELGPPLLILFNTRSDVCLV
jgi:hypothetical protein